MKILVCTDGSEQSLKAVREAAVIAAAFKDAEITVLNVYDDVHSSAAIGYDEGFSGEEVARYLRELDKHKKEEGARILEEAAAILQQKHLKVNKSLVQGRPAPVIINTAAEGGFDLVVIGSRGLGGLKKLLLGSVSNAVVQEVQTSVLIVR